MRKSNSKNKAIKGRRNRCHSVCQALSPMGVIKIHKLSEEDAARISKQIEAVQNSWSGRRMIFAAPSDVEFICCNKLKKPRFL